MSDRYKYLPFIFMALLTLQTKAQWVQTGGLVGGNIRCLALNGSTLYAGVEGAGIYRSSNNGSNWSSTALVNLNVTALASSGAYLYAGTDAGVYLSTDNGFTWTPTSGGYLPTSYINTLVLKDTAIFAGTSTSVYRSIDRGLHWTDLKASGWNNYNVQALAISAGNLLAGTARGAHRSTNNGTSWIAVDSGLTNTDIQALGATGNNIFAGTRSGAFRSTNNGTKWTSAGLAGFYVYSLTFKDSSVFAGTTAGAFFSSDNGGSWTPINNGFTNAIIYSLVSSSAALFAGTAGGGVFRSTSNGRTWFQTGLIATDVSELVGRGSTILAGIWGSGIYRSTDGGASWKQANSGLKDTYIQSMIAGVSYILAGIWSGLYISRNDGAAWIKTGLNTKNVRALAMNAKAIYAGNDAGEIYLSGDSGTSWTLIDSELIKTKSPLRIYSLTVKGAGLFAGTNKGLSLTTDDGLTWKDASSGFREGYIHTLTISDTTLFACDDTYGVFRSTNNGSYWSKQETGFSNPDTWINSFAVSGRHVFAGTILDGAYVSANNGESWTQVNTGLLNTSILSFLVSGVNLIAGVKGAGLWRRPLAEVTTPVEENTNKPVDPGYALNQNYPNPFNPTTIIRFDLPEPSIVTLKVYNILGHEVANLIDSRKMERGAQEAEFNASDLPSGVYWYRIGATGIGEPATSFKQARRMLLLR